MLAHVSYRHPGCTVNMVIKSWIFQRRGAQHVQKVSYISTLCADEREARGVRHPAEAANFLFVHVCVLVCVNHWNRLVSARA